MLSLDLTTIIRLLYAILNRHLVYGDNSKPVSLDRQR